MIPRIVKRSLKARLASPHVWPAFARLLPRAAVVLAYHRIVTAGSLFRGVDVDQFRAQMAWLRRHCTIVAPTEVRAALDTRCSAHRLPVVITFDDGYRDFAEHAYPVLKAFDIPAVNFV